MGYAVAEAAHRRGARVILVSGPTDLKIPEAVEWVPGAHHRTNARAVREHAREANIVIMAAAVADYRPAAAQAKKSNAAMAAFTLELEPTPDILAELGREKLVASSSASPQKRSNVAENARGKLQRKSADMIVANDVTQAGAGFDTDTNIVTLFLRDGREIALPQLINST